MRLAHPYVEPARAARHLGQAVLAQDVVDEAGAIHAAFGRVGGAVGVGEVLPGQFETGFDELSHARRLRAELQDLLGREGGVGRCRRFGGGRNFRLGLGRGGFRRRGHRAGALWFCNRGRISGGVVLGRSRCRARLLFRRRCFVSVRLRLGFRRRCSRRSRRKKKRARDDPCEPAAIPVHRAGVSTGRGLRA